MRFKTNLKIKSGIIDPVPLMDIMLQVVVFFILATQFIGRPGLVLELPQAGTTTLYKETTARVTITNEKLFLHDEEITMGQLREELGKRLTSILVIEADKDIPYSQVVEIIDLAQRMGISQIAIATEERK